MFPVDPSQITLFAQSAVFGLGIGLTMGLTGAGGGILSVPVLLLGLGMGMHNAKPLSLLAVALGASVGAWQGWRQGMLRYRAVPYMSLMGALVSPLGGWLALQLGQRVLVAVFSAVLVLVGWRSLRQLSPSAAAAEAAVPTCTVDPASGRFIWTPACFITLGGIGAVTGLLSGMLGVGGGFFMVPMLQRFTNLRYQVVLVTSLGVIALVSGVTALQILAQGASLGGAMALYFMAATM
ncbi:MAG: sulfite exporter TauE/SafE family protein, partial [Brachymonas sp.]|nr:sulfite exporter TauE/SafE family protein [Brachymonas sp.]